MVSNRYVNLHISKREKIDPIEVVQYDSGIHFEFTIVDEVVPENSVATIYFWKPSRTPVVQQCTVEGQKIIVDVNNHAFDEHGKVKFQITIASDEKEVSTFTNVIDVYSKHPEGAIDNKTIVPAFEEATQRVLSEIDKTKDKAVEYISNGVDATLSKAGLAADAKVTGDSIAELRTGINKNKTDIATLIPKVDSHYVEFNQHKTSTIQQISSIDEHLEQHDEDITTITESLEDKIDTTTVEELLEDKVSKVEGKDLFSGKYSDLIGVPTIQADGKPLVNIVKDQTQLIKYIFGGYIQPLGRDTVVSNHAVAEEMTSVNWQCFYVKIKPDTTYHSSVLDFDIYLFDENDQYVGSVNKTNRIFTTTSDARKASIILNSKRNTDKTWFLFEEPNPAKFPKKKIIFIGDSITAGSCTNHAYHMYFTDIYGFDCYNYGFSGCGYIHNNTNTLAIYGDGAQGIGLSNASKYIADNNVYDRIPNIPNENIDVVVIFAGSNDWGAGGCKISDFRIRVDETLARAIDRFPNSTIITMTPIHRAQETSKNKSGHDLSEFADVIRQISAKYSIQCIDMFADAGLYPVNDQHNILFFTNDVNTTNDSGEIIPRMDGLHPNAIGHYKMFRQIEKQVVSAALANEFIGLY